MSKIWQYFYLPTILFAFHARPVWACPPEEFAGQLRGSQHISLASSLPKLVVVEQQVQDIKIFVDSDFPFWVDGPGGRNGADFLFLETEDESSEIELCFYSIFAHSAEGSYQLQQIEITPSNPAVNEKLRALNSGGAAWV